MNGRYTNFLLTGESGVGKTTIIMEVLGELNVRAGGFFTQEIKSGKTQKGFQLVTLDGQQAVLASLTKKSTYKVGKFAVDIDVMTQLAVPALVQALGASDLIVIDEIGKMECFSKEFRDIVTRCLDSDTPVLGTIQNFASPFINTITNRPDVVMITIDTANRDDMPVNLQVLMEEILKGKKAAGGRKSRDKRR
ncbi:AAA family ATPase [bacterium]|nr:AAA family ATPase [candidate division CSSED10-310 bacterium]